MGVDACMRECVPVFLIKVTLKQNYTFSAVYIIVAYFPCTFLNSLPTEIIILKSGKYIIHILINVYAYIPYWLHSYDKIK